MGGFNNIIGYSVGDLLMKCSFRDSISDDLFSKACHDVRKYF